MERNDYQNAFLQHIADMQETRVDITLGQHKLYDHENYDKKIIIGCYAWYGL